MSTIVVDEAALRRVVAEVVERVIQPALAALGDLCGNQGATVGDGLMTAEQVAERLQVDRRTLRRLIRAGDIPAPITIADRILRWRRSILENWIESQEKRALRSRPHAGSVVSP